MIDKLKRTLYNLGKEYFMNKVFVILSLIICSCVSVPKSSSFDDALGTGMQKIQNDLPEGSQVAILDFKSDNENLSAYIIEEMYDKLINFGKLSIMERSRINTIAMEIGYQLSGEVDDNEIIEIGHQLGADYVVTGEIIFSGEAYRLRVFAIDIAKGRRIASSSLNINRNDRQINHLISTRTSRNTSVIETSINIRDNEEIILIAAQNLFKNVPRNSRILITGISGSNEIQPQYIRTLISDEARNMPVIFEEQRLSAIKVQKDSLSGLYSDDSAVSYGRLSGANVIITGGIYGTGETRRIVFRALDVQTAQILAMSCVLFRQTNTEFINDVEELIRRINNGLSNNVRNGSAIAISNSIGTRRNADFIFDMIENNLVNQQRNKIVTRTGNSFDLIRKEQEFQMTGWVSDETVIIIGRFIGADFLMNMESVGTRTQINILNVSNGNRIIQETL